jgi:hypothetical protein
MYVMEPQPDPPFWRRFMVRVFVVALLLRLLFGVWVCSAGRVVELDSHDYLSLSKNLEETGTFARDRYGRVPDLKRTPVYPILLLISRGTEKFPYILLLLQSLMGAAACLFVLDIARSFEFTDRMGRFAAWLLALDPLSISHCALILSETLFSFLVVAWLWVFARIWSGKSHRFLVFGLFSLASLLTLTRPIGLFLFLPSLIAFGSTLKSRSTPAIWLLLGFILGLAPMGLWLGRNVYHSRGVVFTTIGATNLLEYRGAGVKSVVDKRSFLQARAILRNKYGHDDPSEPPVQAREAAELKTKKGLEILRAHPKIAAKQAVRGLAIMLVAPGAGSVLKSTGIHEGGTGIYSALSTFDREKMGQVWQRLEGKRTPIFMIAGICSLFLFVLYVSMAFGLWGCLFEPGLRPRFFGMLLLAALIVVPAAGPESEPRFRLPIMIFLAMAAAPALTRFFDWWNDFRYRSGPEEEGSPIG